MVVIALLTLNIHVPYAQSLKDKRQAVRRVKDRLRTKFNVAVAEVEHQELWQRSQVSVVTVGTEDQYVEQLLKLAAEEAQRVIPDCIVETNIEIV